MGRAAVALATLAPSLVAAVGVGCGSSDDSASAEAGPVDAGAATIDLCDAFTGVGTACPAASAFVCFPMCDSGGCSCHPTPDGPRWGCVTDRSCEQVCAPIDDACASEASSE